MKGKMKEHHEKLTEQLGRIGAMRRTLKDSRRKLHERAEEQYASMPAAIHAAEQHVEAGKAGILGFRALRKLHTERARLANIVLPKVSGLLDDDG